jgi:tetratricopeptide (TPR) repeat protein
LLTINAVVAADTVIVPLQCEYLAMRGMAQLQRMQRQDPRDRALVFAVAEVLQSQGRDEDALGVLTAAARSEPGDLEVARRLVALHLKGGDVKAAAVQLITTLGANPDSLRDVSPMFSDLMQMSRRHHLRLGDLARLQVPAEAEAARLYLLSRVAAAWNRDALQRESLQKAVRLRPPFAPAYRSLQMDQWGRSDWDEAQKAAASEALADEAQRDGSPILAMELRALSLLSQKKLDEAAKLLGDAMHLPSPSLEL